MQFIFLKRLLVSLALVSSVRADYYIDDQNYTSLHYSQNPGGSIWGPFGDATQIISIPLANGTDMAIDASQCYNYTYTYAACTIDDNCQVQIPFTGSGIIIYVLQAGPQGTNASLTIDGGAPNYNVLPAPPPPSLYIPNVTLFSIQGLATGDHTATMTVLNWDNIYSGMMFDAVLINQTIVLNMTTSSVASSTAASTMSNPTSTATSSSNPTTNVGAIVGGVVGGLAALIALLAIFYLRRHRREAQSADLDANPKIEPFFSADPPYPQGPQWDTDVTGLPTTESLVTGAVGAHSPPHSTVSDSARHEKSRLDVRNPSTVQITNASVTSPTQAGSSTAYLPSGPLETPRPQRQQTHSMLTDDQADFINSLYANNVPAGAIAHVIERMMAGERQPAVDGCNSLPPPSYHHGTGNE